MATESFLGGRVRKQSLPVYDGPQGSEAPTLKRLMLPQGELAQIWTSEEGLRYLACIELKPGAVRGNHYHHKKVEWIYVLSGETEVVIEDPDSRERHSVSMVRGDLLLIEPGVAHATNPIRAGEALEFAPTTFDLADSVPYILVK